MMKQNRNLQVQIFLSYLMISTAIVLSVFSLGFMTDFYTFFMDGNQEMFQFYKDLQILNNVLFQSSLIFLVLSLLLLAFDINKKIPGIFGALLTLLIPGINSLNGMTLFRTNRHFMLQYEGLDYAALEGYTPSMTPFHLVYILFGLAILFSFALFFVTGTNCVIRRKKGESHAE